MQSQSPAIPTSLDKAVPTLGHAVSVWMGAASRLPGAPEILAAVDVASPMTLELVWNEAGWWIAGCSWLPERLPWLQARRQLHLPSLKHRWIREVRRSRFEFLRQHVAPAWQIVEEACPPGSVIAGLHATSWAEAINHAKKSGSHSLADAGWISHEPAATHRSLINYGKTVAGRFERT